MSSPLTVVGGTIGSLVLSLVAARHGRQVKLYLDPAKIGGSFAGVLSGERRFDLGCRLFELEYEEAIARPLSTFDPQVDNHRPFISDVAAFIKDVLKEELRPAAVPEMWINGRKTRCVLMTVDLSDLPGALEPADRALVCEQSRRLLSTHPPATLPSETLGGASLAQHGTRLHELLTVAICNKQYPHWQQIMTPERRKLWAALFHTQTVFEAFAGLPISFLPKRPFFTTTAGVAYPFVERLYGALQALPNVDICPAGSLSKLQFERPGFVTLEFSSAPPLRVHGETCAIGVPPDQLFRAAGFPYSPDRISSSILWVDVAQQDVLHVPSSLMICDPEVDVLRISGAGWAFGNQSFAVEFGCLTPRLDAAAAALRQTGCVTDGAAVKMAHQVSGPAQVAPTRSNLDCFDSARSNFASFPGILLGGARRFGFESLNDQIVDGLYFGEALC